MSEDKSLRYRELGLILGAASFMMVLAAGAWAAQCTGAKPFRQDDKTVRGAASEIRLAASSPATSAFQTAQSTGGRLADVDRDKRDKGGKGGRNNDANQTPVNRGRSPDTGKPDWPTKKPTTTNSGPSQPSNKNSSIEGVKKNTTLPPSSGNHSSIEDVRKRFDGQKSDRVVMPEGSDVRRLQLQKNMQESEFQRRLKAGDFQRVTAGETANKLKLADQYRLYQKGDVARQLGLQKAAVHPAIYQGVISPAYKKHCMKYSYWGPAFFAGVCLYPSWSPWVDWSWHHHCPPYWDPRPIWCRPVIYGPCPAWVYWETPAWIPLPEIACGTWIALRPADVGSDDNDLRLVAVRFVDPGHPEEKLGPRYRVWFRNNGSQAISQPFSITLFAGKDDRLREGMAQAGVRVTAIDPGEVQSVDIRLPAEVLALGRDAGGKPVPFEVLQVLVDANDEIAETTKANNGARLAPAEILPVDPAAFELKPTKARPGEEILLAGEGLGPQPGRVLVQLSGREIDGEILGWYDLGVQWTLPKLALAGPTEANVIVIRGDGAAANPVTITVSP